MRARERHPDESIDRHAAPQVEQCGLLNSLGEGLRSYDYVLRYTTPSKMANDTLMFLKNEGLEAYYYRMGNYRKEPMFASHTIHFSNARNKLKEYYSKELALLAYEIMERDYRILGFEFPFPGELKISQS